VNKVGFPVKLGRGSWFVFGRGMLARHAERWSGPRNAARSTARPRQRDDMSQGQLGDCVVQDERRCATWHVALLALGVAWFAIACGYQPAYGGERPRTRLSVIAAPSRAPEAGALSAILSGLRGELSRAGVLGSGRAFPRVVVELVRVDERGTAQTLLRDPNSGAQLPQASGALIGVTARAWVETSPSEVERDTGDVRRAAPFGSANNAGLDSMQREAALSAAGEATGEALGRRIMGEVESTQEPM
jgi:hypothetical protein